MSEHIYLTGSEFVFVFICKWSQMSISPHTALRLRFTVPVPTLLEDKLETSALCYS